MKNIYKYDLENNFDSHSFNITERGSLFDIEVLDKKKKFLGKTTVGSRNACYLFARRLLGIDDHVLPLLTARQRDSLKKVPHHLEVMVVAFDEEPVIYTKYRHEEEAWV